MYHHYQWHLLLKDNPSQLNLMYKELKVKTKDNLTLFGWLVYKKEKVQLPTILYFHENAGNIGFRLVFIKKIVDELNMNVIIFGYRGYGKSEGSPTDFGLKLDGYSISSWLFSNNNANDINDFDVNDYVDKNNIFLFGRSLGGAIAIDVA
jgi:fermentation-respiration switch protein FrsA (DUF1100 family)